MATKQTIQNRYAVMCAIHSDYSRGIKKTLKSYSQEFHVISFSKSDLDFILSAPPSLERAAEWLSITNTKTRECTRRKKEESSIDESTTLFNYNEEEEKIKEAIESLSDEDIVIEILMLVGKKSGLNSLAFMKAYDPKSEEFTDMICSRLGIDRAGLYFE